MAGSKLGYEGGGVRGYLALIIFYALLSLPSTLHSAPETDSIQYELEVTLRDSDLNLETPATVKMKASGRGLRQGSCIYFSLLDPLQARSQALLAIGAAPVIDKASRQSGEIQNLQSAGLEALSPFLYRLEALPPSGELSLSYAILLAGWKDRATDQRLLTQFYPQILSSCPGPAEEPMFVPQEPVDFKVKLDYPSHWSLLAPGTAKGGAWNYRGRQFSAVLYKKGQVKQTQTGNGRLSILSNSISFQDLEAPAIKAIELFTQISGMPPENDLIIVETGDFEPFNAPGLIALNRPQQKIMQKLQEEYLHWNVWQLSRALAEQWFGLAIKPATLNDYWLIQGFADDMMLQYVESERLLSNLFIGNKGEEAYIQFHFKQAQDLQAALLSLNFPDNALVDSDLRSFELSGLRSPYNFIRHSQALRYLHWYLREPAYGKWQKRLVQRFTKESMSPLAVLETLREEVDRPQASHELQKFWQSDSWPDLAVGDVGADPERGGTRVEIKQLSSLRVSVDVHIKTKAGIRYTQEFESETETSFVQLDADPSEIEEIEIDPQRALFDSDRYNNSDRLPQVTLFPGGARTLRDDAYTVLWVPLASKLPGQSLSLQLNWQVLRYLGSGISGNIYYFPDRGTFGMRASYKKNIPDLALSTILSVIDGDGSTTPGERLWDLRLQRSPITSRLRSWTVDSRLRLRQMVGNAEASHMTSALTLSYRTDKLDICSYDLKGEYEASAWVPNDAFQYARSFGMARFGCDLPWIQFRLRGFMGATRAEGEVPGGARFLPQNLGEARIRLDKPKLSASMRLRSASFDLSLPARLPLPDSAFVLPRRSVFKVYSDWGVLQQPDSYVQVAGAGYGLPFGGDVVGKSSITFLQLSLYAVLYRRFDNKTDTKPGFLFDLGGDL